ncbi:hypothetical protein F2Q69_00006258 [Brassica cretica]|uniref:Uncharacterized protein n=1 Tax=Brassica cretica TaxID=69181 RepID=A0A8S9NXD6_BRACR|nr:hypothetical protein F2Q69_00006258 [Brassica cretica]
MSSSSRSNKEIQLIFSSAFDPQRKTLLIDRQQHQFVARFSPTTVDPDTNLDDRHSLTTVTRSPPSTEDTLPSTDIFHLTLIDTSVRTSIDTEP